MNAINIIIAENEEKSPLEPLSVRRGKVAGFGAQASGYKKGENIVTLFTGWGILSAANWKVNVWGPNMNYPQIIKDIYNQQSPGLFGTFVVLSPPIANFVKDAGYDTVEKLTEFVTDAGVAKPAPKQGPGGRGGFFMGGNNFNVVVTGASNNNYWMIGGMIPFMSVKIDDWR